MRASPACAAISALARLGFAKAKMSGTRQLVAVAFGTYARPIPTPVRTLSPARDTCEQCHWPEKFHGDKIRRIYEYAEDEQNTESVTALQVHVGGGNERLGIAQGIHWHMNIANEVEYIATDDQRQVIPWVRVKDRLGDGSRVRGRGRDAGAARERRAARDGLHGLPQPPEPSHRRDRRARRQRTHGGQRHPEDAALHPAGSGESAQGHLPVGRRGDGRELPRRCAISTALERPACPAAPAEHIEKAVQATTELYRRNVFPEMNVTLRHLSEQHRSRGFSRLFSLPRRRPQDQGRQAARPGLRDLSPIE